MPTTTNKQRLLTQLFANYKKYAGPADEEPRPVLEQMLYAVCRENATRARADRAFQSLRETFFDWNEVRVSSAREVEEALLDLPDTEPRAQRIIGLLQEVFETTFSFDLESLRKKPLKQAAKQISRFQASNDYLVAWVVQQALGGHAIPVDAATLRVLRRLGLIDGDQEDPEALRSSVEHLVPKARGAQFGDIVSGLAEEWGEEDETGLAVCASDDDRDAAEDEGDEGDRGGRTKPR